MKTEKTPKYVTLDEVQNFRKEDLTLTGTTIAKVDQDVTHLTGIVGNIINAGIHTEKNVKSLGTVVENLENKFKTVFDAAVDRTTELAEEVDSLKECVDCICDEAHEDAATSTVPARIEALDVNMSEVYNRLNSLEEANIYEHKDYLRLQTHTADLKSQQDELSNNVNLAMAAYNIELTELKGKLETEQAQRSLVSLHAGNIDCRNDGIEDDIQVLTNRVQGLDELISYRFQEYRKAEKAVQELQETVSRLQTSLRNIENGAPTNGKQYRILLSCLCHEGPHKYFIQKWNVAHSCWLSTDGRFFRWEWQAKRHLRKTFGRVALEQLQ